MTIFPSFFVNKTGGYEIEQSLRFDGSAYIDAPDDVFGNETGTYSFWVKRSELGAENTILWNKRAGDNHWGFRFDGADTFTLFKTASGSDSSTTTTAKFRDPSAWYHILVTTTDTANEVFVNGTSVATGSYEWAWQDANPRIGYRSSTDSFQGYLAEWHYISGSVKSVSDFTETDDNGVLRPIEYEGSYGTNGYYLKFDTADTNGILHDSSGQANHFDSSTGFTTSGTGTDVMSDTPTKNYATLNPLITHSGTAGSYEEGNLRRKNSTNIYFAPGFSSIAVTSGKWYFECSGDTSSYVQMGFVDASQISSVSSGYAFRNPTRGWAYQSSGLIGGNNDNYIDNTAAAATTSGDVIGCAVDFDSGSAEWYVNGTQTGATLDFSSHLATGRTWHLGVAVTNEGTDVVDVNFGQRAFDISSVPTGFKALNTSNLPAPEIKDGSKYFKALTYTGTNNGSSTPRDLDEVGWKPDLVWIKNRGSSTYNHVLFDAVRGVNKSLTSNSTAAETDSSAAGYVSEFRDEGFALKKGSLSGAAGSGNVDRLSHTYVAWNWLGANGTESLTAGSIDSTVSANPTAGFSIVTYTGNATSGATVAHGLGVKPKVMIVRQIDGTSHWAVYTEAEGAGRHLLLNSQNASAASGSNNYFTAEPTSTVFTVGSNGNVNANNGDILAYCFAEVEGYSKFGTYTGNGNANGPFVYTGFSVSWLMVKKNASSTDWKIYDVAREPYNVVANRIAANTSNAELDGNAQDIDFLSNGFKFRGTNGDQNSSGTFYYFAFASNPFGGSGVSPATAR